MSMDKLNICYIKISTIYKDSLMPKKCKHKNLSLEYGEQTMFYKKHHINFATIAEQQHLEQNILTIVR